MSKSLRATVEGAFNARFLATFAPLIPGRKLETGGSTVNRL
jgi:hypothetical protein